MGKLFEHFMATAEGRETVRQACKDNDLSELAIKYACQLFEEDERRIAALPAQFKPMPVMREVWDNRGAGRGKGRVVDYVEDETAEEWRTGGTFAERLENILQVATAIATRAARVAVPPSAAAAPTKADERRRKDAIRKREARAAGKVKARPRKAPRTLAQEVESARKALETRKAKLSRPDAVLAMSAGTHMRLLESIRRSEKTLATYESRLAAEQGK
jgi:hypothetical protein